MSETFDFVELKHNARISAAKRSEWVYLRRYSGPTVRRYIATRKPTPTELAHTFFFVEDYAEAAGCSMPYARRQLTALARAGFIEKRNTAGGATAWFFCDSEDTELIGRRIIKKLRREGLVFDDYKI
ncbi:hypothetical protein [Xanthomonas phage OP2]|uniref:Uncharacterized protein n=1 Tax=Xanthomonas phage OP2 TaxID=331627 RepID=Q2NP78_9CAUD|nr:hypothetical protein OP2_ORF54 [Xanthomonas phage OP2]BAE72818.1 hypothetical protein [Xanthomonas phage OP2]